MQGSSRLYEKLNIYGNDWETNDGTCIRDYIHVMDLADAHLSALNYLSKNKKQIIDINIGTGKGTSVLELVRGFAQLIVAKYHLFFAKDVQVIYLVWLQITIKQLLF